MYFDSSHVLTNARAATTDDLLDRVTVFRAGMEPEALELFEMELRRRGVTPEQIDIHARQYETFLRAADGTVLVCSRCRKPAVNRRWSWHRLWGILPVFPKKARFCVEHQPENSITQAVD